MIPLYDHESEKWLIGALLTDAEVQKQLPTLPKDLMHDPLNEKRFYRACGGFGERRESAASAGHPARRRRAGHGGIPDRVHALCGIGASAGHYIARLRGLFRARSAYAMASDFCRRLTEGEDIERLAPTLRTALRGLDAPSGASCAWTSWPAAYTTMWNGGPAAK